MHSAIESVSILNALTSLSTAEVSPHACNSKFSFSEPFLKCKILLTIHDIYHLKYTKSIVKKLYAKIIY